MAKKIDTARLARPKWRESFEILLVVIAIVTAVTIVIQICVAMANHYGFVAGVLCALLPMMVSIIGLIIMSKRSGDDLDRD